MYVNFLQRIKQIRDKTNHIQPLVKITNIYLSLLLQLLLVLEVCLCRGIKWIQKISSDTAPSLAPDLVLVRTLVV